MFDVTFNESLATLRFDQGKVNALDLEFCTAMIEQLRELNEDKNCAALIITGKERIFSAGVDLRRVLNEPVDYLHLFLPALTNFLRAILQFEKPIIAAINGHAIAGGCLIACACDYRIISSRARIGLPELRVGVALPNIAIELVRAVASGADFQQIITVGATYSKEEAIRAGLANEVCESEDVMARSVEVAKDFLNVPANVFALTKRQMRTPLLDNVLRMDQSLGDEINDLWFSDQTRQIVKQYVEKRL